jgi:hypothetical protein
VIMVTCVIHPHQNRLNLNILFVYTSLMAEDVEDFCHVIICISSVVKYLFS